MSEQTPESPDTPRTFAPQAVHLVRTVSIANLQLSQMADQKANLLMGASFVVFTLTVGIASRGPIPMSLIMLGTFAFVSACLAVMAVLPTFGAKPVSDTDPNILFFGVFSGMEEEEFADRVVDELQTDERMFRLMLRDIYQNGKVLQRKKYRLLGWSYRLFLAGLVLSFAAFLFEQVARL